MGIDFNNLIGNLGKTAASLQNDKSKIDTKSELNAFVSGWDAIKAKAEAENAKGVDTTVDINELEGTMKSELAGLMGAEFGKTAGVENKGSAEAPVFSDEEISLENMMALLAPEDGMDIEKLREYNKKPLLSAQAESVDALTDAGFDSELVEIMVESTPGAVKYISDAIKSGSADRISSSVTADTEEFDTPEAMDTAYLLRGHSNYAKLMHEQQLKELNKHHTAKMAQLATKFGEAKTDEERENIGNMMMLEEMRDMDYRKSLETLFELNTMED